MVCIYDMEIEVEMGVVNHDKQKREGKKLEGFKGKFAIYCDT